MGARLPMRVSHTYAEPMQTCRTLVVCTRSKWWRSYSWGLEAGRTGGAQKPPDPRVPWPPCTMGPVYPAPWPLYSWCPEASQP